MMLAFVTGLVGMFKGNIKFLNITKRRQSFWLTAISFILLITFSSLVEQDTDELDDPAEPALTEEVVQEEAEENEQVEKDNKPDDQPEEVDPQPQENSAAEKEADSDLTSETVESLDRLKVHFID